MLQRNKIKIYNKPSSVKIKNNDLKLWIDDILLINSLTGFMVNIIFVDKEKINFLNKKYRNIDKPTDVISFSFVEGKFPEYSFNMLGDIYICVDMIKPHTEKEILRRMVHGILHLVGYNHKGEREYKKFIKLENRYLSILL